MQKHLLTALVGTALVAGTVSILPAPTSSAAVEPWRVSTLCTQDGTLKVRLDHDENAAGQERISAEFRAFTAVGQQTWDWKTKINGALWTKGVSTTDDSGDLRVQVNRAGAGQPAVTSLSFDGTNRSTGERCRMTVAVPPVDQPLQLDLDPWYAQGFCSQGTPWQLRVARYVRMPSNAEKFTMRLRVLDGEADQWWHTRGSVDGVTVASGHGFTQEITGNIIWSEAALYAATGVPLEFETARVWAEKDMTGEICRVDITAPPLP